MLVRTKKQTNNQIYTRPREMKQTFPADGEVMIRAT
jgi:hypothetical protein